MRKIIFFLSIILFPAFCSAQTTDERRLEMIVKAVNFSASKLNFEGKPFIPNESNYLIIENKLKAYPKGNTLFGKFRSWSIVRGDTKERKAVKAVRNEIIKDLPEIIANLDTNAVDYKNFRSELDNLAGVKEKQPTQGNAPGSPTSEEQNVKSGSSDSIAIIAQQIKKLEKQIPDNNLVLAGVAIAVIGLLIAIVALRKKSSNKGSEETDSAMQDKKNLLKEIDNLKSENINLHQKVTKLAEELTKLEADIRENERSVRNKLTELENKPAEIIFENIPKKNTASATNNTDNLIASTTTSGERDLGSNATDAEMLYAKYSDVEAGGFSPSILKDTQNGERVFEIHIAGTTGTYSISGDEKVQRYALQNFEYLDAACNVKGTPQSNGKIVTLKPGTLTMSEEGDWIIVEKADIEFK